MEERSRELEQGGADTGNPVSSEIQVKYPFRSSLVCPDTCLLYLKSKKISVGDGTGNLADTAVIGNRDPFVSNVLKNNLRLGSCANFKP